MQSTSADKRALLLTCILKQAANNQKFRQGLTGREVTEYLCDSLNLEPHQIKHHVGMSLRRGKQDGLYTRNGKRYLLSDDFITNDEAFEPDLMHSKSLCKKKKKKRSCRKKPLCTFPMDKKKKKKKKSCKPKKKTCGKKRKTSSRRKKKACGSKRRKSGGAKLCFLEPDGTDQPSQNPNEPPAPLQEEPDNWRYIH